MRDSLIDKGLIVIPRPHYNNMQFVATRGRQGFYRVSLYCSLLSFILAIVAQSLCLICYII